MCYGNNEAFNTIILTYHYIVEGNKEIFKIWLGLVSMLSIIILHQFFNKIEYFSLAYLKNNIYIIYLYIFNNIYFQI